MSREMASAVSLGTAAKLVGRGQTTIRDWIKNDLIKAKRNDLGHWMIERDSLLGFASSEGSKEGPRKVAGATARAKLDHSEPTQTGNSESLIEALRGEIAYLREMLRDERTRCKDLERERTQHLAEMRALLSKDAKATDGVISRWLRR